MKAAGLTRYLKGEVSSILIGLILMGGCVGLSAAQSLNPVDPAAEVIENLAQEDRLRRLEDSKPGISIAPAIGTVNPGEECVTLSNIRVEGVSIDSTRDVWLMRKRPVFDAQGVLVSEGLLETGTIEDLIARFGSTCMGVSAINRLIGELTNAYVVQGYITSRVYIPDQDLSTGELVLLAVEGVVESIPVAAQVAPDPETGEVSSAELERALVAAESQAQAALATDVGDYLNLRLFEQSIDNLNAVPSTKASLQLVPGQGVGGTVVPISLEYEKPWRASLGANDRGNASTGELNVSASFEYDNLLDLNDQIRLDYSGAQDTNAVVFTGKLPAGLHNWKVTASYSEYRFILNNITELFGQNGSFKLGDERLITRDAVDKHWMYGEFAWDGSQRYINGLELTFVSNTVAKIGYKNELQVAADRWPWIAREGKMFWDVYADIDLGKLPGSRLAQRAEPRVVVTQTWSQQIAKPLTWTSVITGQVAGDSLRAARQLSLPGVTAGPGGVDSGVTFAQSVTMKDGFNWMNGGQLGDLSISSALNGGWGSDIANGTDKWTLGADFNIVWDYDDWNRTIGYVLPIRSSDDNPGDPELWFGATRKW